MDPVRINNIVTEELSKAYNEILEYLQFKLSKSAQMIVGRISQELIEKEKQQ